MKRISLFGLIGIMLLLLGVFIGCEEDTPLEEGTITFRITDIDSSKHYFFTGDSNLDAHFRADSRKGDVLIITPPLTVGEFTSPVVQIGNWTCQVYELNTSVSYDATITDDMIVRRATAISVTVTADDDILYTVVWD